MASSSINSWDDVDADFSEYEESCHVYSEDEDVALGHLNYMPSDLLLNYRYGVKNLNNELAYENLHKAEANSGKNNAEFAFHSELSFSCPKKNYEYSIEGSSFPVDSVSINNISQNPLESKLKTNDERNSISFSNLQSSSCKISHGTLDLSKISSEFHHIERKKNRDYHNTLKTLPYSRVKNRYWNQLDDNHEQKSSQSIENGRNHPQESYFSQILSSAPCLKCDKPHLRSSGCDLILCNSCGARGQHYSTNCPFFNIHPCRRCGLRVKHENEPCPIDLPEKNCNECRMLSRHLLDRCPRIWRVYNCYQGEEETVLQVKSKPRRSSCPCCGGNHHYDKCCSRSYNREIQTPWNDLPLAERQATINYQVKCEEDDINICSKSTSGVESMNSGRISFLSSEFTIPNENKRNNISNKSSSEDEYMDSSCRRFNSLKHSRPTEVKSIHKTWSFSEEESDNSEEDVDEKFVEHCREIVSRHKPSNKRQQLNKKQSRTDTQSDEKKSIREEFEEIKNEQKSKIQSRPPVTSRILGNSQNNKNDYQRSTNFKFNDHKNNDYNGVKKHQKWNKQEEEYGKSPNWMRHQRGGNFQQNKFNQSKSNSEKTINDSHASKQSSSSSTVNTSNDQYDYNSKNRSSYNGGYPGGSNSRFMEQNRTNR